LNWFKLNIIELALLQELFQCLPCRAGCEKCSSNDPCIVEFGVMLRGIPLGIQSFCMTVAIVVGFVLARLRKTKVSKAPGCGPAMTAYTCVDLVNKKS
jgi:hypothetical protein